MTDTATDEPLNCAGVFPANADTDECVLCGRPASEHAAGDEADDDE